MPRADTIDSADELAAIDTSLLQGIVIIRWIAIIWAIAGAVISRDHLDQPFIAGVLLATALGFTLWTTVTLRSDPSRLVATPVLLIEVVIAAVLLIGDGFVFDTDAVITRPQSLPWAWPSAAIISTAIVHGRRLGLLVVAVLAGASFVGEAMIHDLRGWTVAMSSRTALYVLAAVTGGFVAHRLRAAEQQISTARARERLARDMHDGVLQTLAVIQRRSTDSELAGLAADQERDLRSYLFGADAPDADTTDLANKLRERVLQVDRRFGTRSQVVVVDELPVVSADTGHALLGAVVESVTNAAKHADASKIVVYAEPSDDGGVFCSVKDDGTGFDVGAISGNGESGRSELAGQGIAGSVRGRMSAVGGTVDIVSSVERGTEVRLWVP